MNPTITITAQPAGEETRRRAIKLFPLLQKSKKLGQQQPLAKQADWEMIYAGVLQAAQIGVPCRVPTGNRGSGNNRLRRQVLAAAVDSGVLKELPRANTNCRRCFCPGRNWK
jgi:hypothetical protein